MSGPAALPIGGLFFVILTIVILGISVAFASQSNQQAAQINRQNNKPISNGYAIPATVLIVMMIALAFFVGLLPALLRRG